MPNGNVNVLDMKTKGQCSVAVKSAEVILKAGDPASALQAVARQASLQISLTPDEVARFMEAGQFEISLHYANNRAGAIDAAKYINQLTSETVLAMRGKASKRRSLGKILGLLVLAVMMGAVIFAVTVAVLDGIYGSRNLSNFIR